LRGRVFGGHVPLLIGSQPWLRLQVSDCAALKNSSNCPACWIEDFG
jgi:hypothetical protein